MYIKKYFLFFLFIIYYITDFHKNINISMKTGIICIPIIFSGELWRIILSIFMHYNFTHLLSNYIILFTLNTISNKLITNIIYIFIFIITSIIGNIVSLIFNDSNILILGMSGGIYGIIGAFYILLNIKNTIIIFQYFNLNLFLNFFFITQIILPFSFLNDNYLHLIGFLLGIFIINIKYFLKYIYIFLILMYFINSLFFSHILKIILSIKYIFN